jgi:hypothetical protein
MWSYVFGIPKVMRCQKCQKPSKSPSGTFGILSVSVFAETTLLPNQSRTTRGEGASSHPHTFIEAFAYQ